MSPSYTKLGKKRHKQSRRKGSRFDEGEKPSEESKTGERKKKTTRLKPGGEASPKNHFRTGKTDPFQEGGAGFDRRAAKKKRVLSEAHVKERKRSPISRGDISESPTEPSEKTRKPLERRGPSRREGKTGGVSLAKKSDHAQKAQK